MAHAYATHGTAVARVARSARETLFGSVDPSVIKQKITGGKVPARAIDRLQALLGLTRDEVGVVLSASRRTLARRAERNGPLTIEEADKLYRVARIVDLAIEMLGEREKAVRWMRTPLWVLGDRTPLSQLNTDIGTAEVERCLYTLAYGGVA